MNNSLFPSFRKFIDKEQLFQHNDKILLAVSGGADSTAMAHMFKHGEYKFGIAHCNFTLRGEDSDNDAAFVEKMAKTLQVPFHYIKFDTVNYCKQHNISIEMGARQLRYEWFDTLMNNHEYKYLATAHHKDDIIETFLLNFTRGMGINGVHGIPVKNNYIVRPMLCFFRNEIEQYLTQYDISYQTDHTNKCNDYERNKIRNQIIPIFEEINSEFRKSAIRNIEHLKEARAIYKKRIEENITQLWLSDNQISIPNLLKLEAPNSYLYEMLSSYNFNTEVINSISKSLTNISGKQFFSPTHRIVKDRETLIIAPLTPDKECQIKLRFEEQTPPIKFDDNQNIAHIDADKIKNNLAIRKWEIGDHFIPLGMRGRKKVSDFFTDRKFSLIDKEQCNILLDGDQIVWIIGHRLDDRYKITNKTKRILKISIQ